MSAPGSKDRHGNVRLSLECKPAVKKSLLDHGEELKEWALISVIRRSVARSRKLFALEQRGTLLLQRDVDDEIEEIGPLG